MPSTRAQHALTAAANAQGITDIDSFEGCRHEAALQERRSDRIRTLRSTETLVGKLRRQSPRGLPRTH